MAKHILTIPVLEASNKIADRWAKVVIKVDVTKSGGYAFSGKFVAPSEAFPQEM